MTFKQLRDQLDQMSQKDLVKTITFYIDPDDIKCLEAGFNHTEDRIELKYKIGDNTPYIEIGY